MLAWLLVVRAQLWVALLALVAAFALAAKQVI